MLQGMSLSSEELTWLQANALIDPPMEGDDNSFLNNTCDSTSLSTSISCDSDSLYLPTQLSESPIPVDLGASNFHSTQSYVRPSAPRLEWIYRRPKPPIHTSHCTNSSPSSTSYHFNGRTTDLSSLSHSHVTARNDMSLGRLPGDNTISYAANPFSSTIFHSRSHSEHSSLKRSDLGLKRTPSSPSRSKISSPKLMSVHPPSISSSSSISTSASRSSSPRTPASPSSSIYTKTRRPPSYPRHPKNDSISLLSCPPSKSILTRTSSILTKESSITGNKSVKFAAVPVVHYATASYWDLENMDKEETTIGINIDAMDVDDFYHGYRTHVAVPKDNSRMLDIATLRESECTTPTPEREKAKMNGLKRLMSLTRKPLATSTSIAISRPVISMPYALGTHPTSALQSNASLSYSAASATSSVPDLVDMLPLRSAPSLESFRSSKSSATRSVRSMGSLKSSSSIRGLQSWLSRATGWTWMIT